MLTLKRVLQLVLLYQLLKKVYERYFVTQRRAAELIEKLPGPGKEEEGYVLGHVVGPSFLSKGQKFDLELAKKIMITRLIEISKRFEKEGMFRVNALATPFTYLLGTQVSFLLIYDINIVRELLSYKSLDKLSKGKSYDVSHVLIGDSVLHASGEKWAVQRPHVDRAMTPDVMQDALPLIFKTVNELTTRWKREFLNKPVNVCEDCLKLTLDVLGRVAFSHDFNSVTARTTEEAPLYKPFDIILTTLAMRAKLMPKHYLRFLPTRENVIFNEAMDKLDGVVDSVYAARLQRDATTQPKRQDFLDVLLAKDGSGHRLSDRLIKDNIKTMLFAGHDTTGAALANFLYLMATNPNEMIKLREEIKQTCGVDGDPTYEQLEKMPMLNACVLETLRLYPSAGFTRQPNEELELNGVVIPKNMEILILPYMIHRDPKNWDRPNEFVPERFLTMGLDGESSSIVSNSLQSRIARICMKQAYLPFSLGVRNCAGRALALMEMRIVMVKLVQQFNFEMRPSDNPDFSNVPVLDLTLNPNALFLRPTIA